MKTASIPKPVPAARASPESLRRTLLYMSGLSIACGSEGWLQSRINLQLSAFPCCTGLLHPASLVHAEHDEPQDLRHSPKQVDIYDPMSPEVQLLEVRVN